MGTVYLAEQLEPLQRSVALKLIRGQVKGGMAEAYFQVERQALARMDHPAIAKVYDAGTTPQGHPYFAMEWVDGASLAAYCTQHALREKDLLALFMRICLGVHHAHQKGVIHRDLKPSNVLVAEVDGQPMPKIIDFGIAIGATRNSGDGLALMERAGTRGYMSPEQMQGRMREIDIRSDVYALGVMLLELLAPHVVIDRAAILRFSKVGQDIAKQMQTYANQAKNDLASQGKALQAEGRNLQQQVAILAPDVKQKRLDAFRNKEQSLQSVAQRKDEQLKAGFAQARATMEQALGPILQQLVKERGANLVLDKQAVVFANASGFDITGDAINRLNQKLPAIKVNLNAAPPAAPKK
jgi:serine/threonine protein kinase